MATTTAERLQGELQPPMLNDHEAALTKAAQRCLMTALDHSRAKAIVLMDDSRDVKGSPVLELPPQALRLVAQVLGALGDHRAITVVPRTLELTTTDAANYLNVSRPFLIKQLEADQIAYRKVGTHRRIAYADLAAYKEKMKAGQHAALKALADDAQELGLELA
jgi:excisionase family DNA binding protein